MLTVGSLFSGIGGFDLGLERAGMRCVWQCEIDPYCQRVLAKHWPDVLRVPDVRNVRAGSVPAVDILAGGFPCQDLSYAGRGAGINGHRSGLWAEYARLVRELRPRYVLVENVPALLARGLDRVLGDLAACGYDAEWDCIPAAAVGAPHRRDRAWLVAYPQGERRQQGPGASEAVHAGEPEALEPQRRPALLATGRGRADHWAVEPDVGRVANGVPARVDRVRGLGNALVPQIAEWLGHRILDHEGGIA